VVLWNGTVAEWSCRPAEIFDGLQRNGAAVEWSKSRRVTDLPVGPYAGEAFIPVGLYSGASVFPGFCFSVFSSF
jgi:hypothetical protein